MREDEALGGTGVMRSYALHAPPSARLGPVLGCEVIHTRTYEKIET
jgi:hypothetical protein